MNQLKAPIDTNPLHPSVALIRQFVIYKEDREFIGSNKDFPYVATTYRLTEHFHSWTAQSALNIIAQPQQFVEIGEKLAAEKGIQKGDMVKINFSPWLHQSRRSSNETFERFRSRRTYRTPYRSSNSLEYESLKW